MALWGELFDRAADVETSVATIQERVCSRRTDD
jgi:hypothetical protein